MSETPCALTPRQLAVARLVAYCLTNYEISRRLRIRPRTVRSHVAAIGRRLGTQSRLDLAVAVIVLGWVTIDDVAAELLPRIGASARANRDIQAIRGRHDV